MNHEFYTTADWRRAVQNKTKTPKQQKMDASEKNINPKIGLIVGNDWLKQCDRIPKVEQRVNWIYIWTHS